MAVNLSAPFLLKSKLARFADQQFDTEAELKAYDKSLVPEGYIVIVKKISADDARAGMYVLMNDKWQRFAVAGSDGTGFALEGAADTATVAELKAWKDSITGTDSDTIINRWDEIVAALKGINEGDGAVKTLVDNTATKAAEALAAADAAQKTADAAGKGVANLQKKKVNGFTVGYGENNAPVHFTGICTTAAGTAAKTVNVGAQDADGNYEPIGANAIILVHFEKSSNAKNPTLSVNGGAALPIWRGHKEIGTEDYIIPSGDHLLCNMGHGWDLVGEPALASKNIPGLVRNGSSVTSTEGYEPAPIIEGVPYYKKCRMDQAVVADGTVPTDSNTKIEVTADSGFELKAGAQLYVLLNINKVTMTKLETVSTWAGTDGTVLTLGAGVYFVSSMNELVTVDSMSTNVNDGYTPLCFEIGSDATGSYHVLKVATNGKYVDVDDSGKITLADDASHIAKLDFKTGADGVDVVLVPVNSINMSPGDEGYEDNYHEFVLSVANGRMEANVAPEASTRLRPYSISGYKGSINTAAKSYTLAVNGGAEKKVTFQTMSTVKIMLGKVYDMVYDGSEWHADAYETAVGKKGSVGLVRNESDVTEQGERVPVPIIEGVPYMYDDHDRVMALETAINSLNMTSDLYYITSQDLSLSSPDASRVYTNGSKSMIKRLYRPYLIDHTDNAGETAGAYELCRNNIFRFAEDHSFAPAVCITEEQRAACDAELYLDAEATDKYCDAGAFDAETFYNRYGTGQKLYTAKDTEVTHILRPWETTEKKYSTMIGTDQNVWLIDGEGKSGFYHRGVLLSYREFDGIKPRLLKPTAMSASGVCAVTENKRAKTRSFFFLQAGDTNCNGTAGSYGFEGFGPGRTYPRTGDMHQVTDTEWSRNNNSDVTKSYPFTGRSWHAYNTFLCAQEALYGTSYLSNPDRMFSSGISSVDPCGNEAQWLKYGGVRFKEEGGQWKYSAFSSIPNALYADANGTKNTKSWNVILNNERPKMQVNEHLVALSFATETGVAAGKDFELYGGHYRYENVVDADGLTDGFMNAILYKTVTGTVTGYDAGGASLGYAVEVNLRIGVMDGMVPSGDVFIYSGEGMEMVETIKNAYTGAGSTGGNDVDIYLETDQKRFVTETSDITTTEFGFEKSYEKVGTYVNNAAGAWAKNRVGYTPWANSLGASKSTYMSFYVYQNSQVSLPAGKRYRKSCRFGGYATHGNCCPRSLIANSSVRASWRANGGAAQVLIDRRSLKEGSAAKAQIGLADGEDAEVIA